MKNKYAEYSPLLLRISIGILFLIAGFNKLIDPSKSAGMLTGLGFPIPLVMAWILLLSELIFGVLIIIGLKVRYTIWPLVLIFLIAILTVTIPSGNMINVMFHIITIVGLISLALSGPGKFAIKG